MDFDGSRIIGASGDAVWALATDVTRLTEWLPTVAAAHTTHDGKMVELEGESHGHLYKLASPWKTSASERTLEWRGNSGDGYAGSLRIVDEPSGSSEVRVHVSVPEERVNAFPGAEAEIKRGMEDALDRLSALATR